MYACDETSILDKHKFSQILEQWLVTLGVIFELTQQSRNIPILNVNQTEGFLCNTNVVHCLVAV